MYSVVHFTSENTVESVPSKWLVENNGKYRCYWPTKLSNDRITKLIKKNCDSSDDWNLCQCQVKFKCNTYEESRAKCNDATYLTMSDISLSSDNDSSSNDEPAAFQPPPKKKQKKTAEASQLALPSTSTAVFLSKKPKKTPEASMLALPSTSTAVFLSKDHFDTVMKEERELLKNNAEMYLNAISKLQKEVIDIKEEVKQIRKANKIMHVAPDRSQFPQLPVKTDEELMKFEEELQSNEMSLMLINYLVTFSTSEARRSVHQIMKRVATNEVLINYSLHGKQSKKAFIELKLCTCIRGNYDLK